jgi:hypothetical protein
LRKTCGFARNKSKNFEKGIDKRRKRWYNIEVASEEPRKRLFGNEKIKKNSKNFEKPLDKSF